jgi:exonuclease SbcD
MKILHCGDIHFRNDLVEEIIRCTDFMIGQAIKEKPDLSIIAGDLFDERQAYDSPAFKAAVDFVRKLADVSPVYILKGTNSHDGISVKFLEALSTRYPVRVAEEIGYTMFLTDFQTVDYEKLITGLKNGVYTNAIILSIPPVSKANLLAHGNNEMEESRLDTIDALRNVLQMFGTIGEEARHADIPVILVGHLTVTGSTLSTGQQMVGREIELGVGDLRMSFADLVCLGHIHKVQSWGEIFYSGSITRLNYGEEEAKGFWIHELSGNSLISSRFIETPARKMITVDLDNESAQTELANITEGSCVRIRYQTTEDQVHTFDELSLRNNLLKAGASEIKIEKTVIPVERVRAEGISKLNSVEDKLRKWAETAGIELTGSIIEKLHQLEQEDQKPTLLEVA